MIYLASPYSHADDAVRVARFEAVCAAAAAMMRKGWHVFSPIAHSHPIAEFGGLPTDFAFWREYDDEMIFNASALWVLTLDGWRESTGVTAEIEIARAYGVPVRLIAPAEVDVMLTRAEHESIQPGVAL